MFTVEAIAAIQYNMPDKNIDILLIAIYCNMLPSKLYVSDYYTTKMTGPLVTIHNNFLLFYMST